MLSRSGITSNKAANRRLLWYQLPAMPQSNNTSERGLFAAMALLAMLGVAMVAYANRFGADLEPDSDVYISAGMRLARGQGVSFPNFLGDPDPMLVFPPMFPVQISILERLHVNPQLGIGYTQALCVGLLIVMTTWLAWKVSRSGLIALLVGYLVLTNPGILYVHTVVMSEPPFLIWVMTGLWCLSRWWTAPRGGWIAIGGLCVAVAVMTRNAGAPLVPLGMLAILLRGAIPVLRRVFTAVSFGAIAGGPLAIWSWIHHSNGGALAGRAVGWHGLAPYQIHDAGETLGVFVFPWNGPGQMIVVAVIGLVAVVCTVVALRGIIGTNRAEVWNLAVKIPAMVPLCLAFAVAFVVFDIFAIEVVGSGELDKRVLSVIVPPLAIVLAWWAGMLLRTIRLRAFRGMLVLGMVAVLGSYSWAAFRTVSAHSSEAVLEWSPWRQSDTLDVIRQLPADALIYSNKPCCLYMACQRLSEGIPEPIQPGDTDESEIQEMREQLHDHGGWIVYWNEVDGGDEPHMSADEIRAKLPVAETQQVDDGLILRIDPVQDATAAKTTTRPEGG
jgi:hypothetical protein